MDDNRFTITELDMLLARPVGHSLGLTPPRPSPLVVTLAVAAAIAGWSYVLLI